MDLALNRREYNNNNMYMLYTRIYTIIQKPHLRLLKQQTVVFDKLIIGHKYIILYGMMFTTYRERQSRKFEEKPRPPVPCGGVYVEDL